MLWWTASEPSLLLTGSSAHLQRLRDNSFNLHLTILKRLLLSLPSSTPAVSSLFNWSSESGCASRSIGAILITCRQSTVAHRWSYITPSLWLYPCFSWFPLSLWSIPLLFKSRHLKSKNKNCCHNQVKSNQYGTLPLCGKCAEWKVMGCKGCKHRPSLGADAVVQLQEPR